MKRRLKIILLTLMWLIVALLGEHKNIKLFGFLVILMGVNAPIVKYIIVQSALAPDKTDHHSSIS